jgi:basic membrane protein A
MCSNFGFRGDEGMNMNNDIGGMTRRAFLAAMGLSALSLVACGGTTGSDDAAKATHKVEMVTDSGGINDQGFCQLSWAGLQKLRDELGYDVSYIESKQDSDYATNIDKAIDYGAEFVWAVGFSMADAVAFNARINPDLNVKFGIVDAGTSGSPNLTGVLFAAQEPSFIVGYIAGKTTQTNKVGFVGGVESDNIFLFEYGYLGGVAYAAKELGKQIETMRQYAESFTDNAKGKSIAQKMYASGADVIYHAAGGTGIGVIDAAKEAGKFAIGVDMDQSYLAPENVLTSAIKRVDHALADLTPKLLNGEIEGGIDVVLGLADGDYLGIPEDHHLMPEGVYEDALKVVEMIKTREIQVPSTAAEYESFIASL